MHRFVRFNSSATASNKFRYHMLVPKFVLGSAIALVIASCGGGGSGGGPSSPPVLIPPTPQTYTVSGTITGLSGGSVGLTNNGGDGIAVSANGNFTFPTGLANGSSYAVSVSQQPATPLQTCIGSNASGTLNGVSVANVQITCVAGSLSVSLRVV